MAATAQAPAGLADVLRAKFAADLEASARQADGVVGYVVIDVESGERFARLDGTQFPTASTIKLAILYELLKQADEGRVSLDAVTPMDRSRAVPGGLLYELDQPVVVAARPGGRDDPAKRQHRDQRADRPASAWRR